MYFTTKVDAVPLDMHSFRQTLREIVDFLEREYPGANSDCNKCEWVERRKGN